MRSPHLVYLRKTREAEKNLPSSIFLVLNPIGVLLYCGRRKFLLYLPLGHRDEGTKIYTRFQRANSYRRVAHYSSSYDKNLDDQVHPTVVPDHVIESKSDKYWGPHPQTGVFGPADKSGSGDFASGLCSTPASADGSSSSVLDQTAWFRPLEDVEKPPPTA